MKVLIGEAVHCEHPGAYGYEGSGHTPGNQTGDELRIIEYYNYPWTRVYRWKNKDMANVFAIRQEQACNNKKIGYSQPLRIGYRSQLLANNGDPSKISIPCDCDCSSLTNANAKYTLDSQKVPTKLSGYEVTAQMPAVYESDPNFENVTSKVNLITGEGLEKGDILVNPGKHTGAVVSVDGGMANTPKFRGVIKKFSGVYKTPKKSVRNHVAAHPYVGKGNLIDVCDESGKFYWCRVAGVYGYILKSRIVKG